MSFSRSNITSGNFITNLTETNGIATKYDSITSTSKLYYTINSGGTWTLAESVTGSSPGFSISLSSTGTPGSLNGIAAGYDINMYPIIYYTTNSGNTWSSSASGLPGISATVINNIYTSISGLNAVIAVEIETNDVLLYYSIDGGNNWTQSTNDSALPIPTLFNIPDAVIKNVAICLDVAIVRYILTLTNSSGGFVIYTSINGGANVSEVLTLSDFDSYSTDLSISGSIALLGGYNTITNNGYLYRSADGGLTWLISINDIADTIFKSVSIDGTVGMAAGLKINDSKCNIYYSTNSGTSWNMTILSAIDVSDIVQIKVSSIYGFVALKTTSLSFLNVLYNTKNSGTTWKLGTNLGYTTVNDISLSNYNSILGTDSGIYYNACSSSYCYSYVNQRYSEIFINYNPTRRYEYYRLTPDYFRNYYPECGYTSYYDALNGTEEISNCLRTQLRSGPIVLYSLEEIFILIVPSINDNFAIVNIKDNIRNKLFAFALNIEKSYLYFNKGKDTCNNNLIPWEAVYDIDFIGDTYSLTFGNNVPLTQYDQYIIYNLSINYFDNLYSIRNRTRLNYYNIIRLALGIPIVGELTVVNFYNLIYFSFVFLNQLFSISQTLLLGKDPGIPKQFLDLFFPFERQKYYYNLYLSWIQSRNKYLGFGDRVNISNGSGTYIPVPGRFTN
jgi:photosystem II stability/assembly factor-like uncharacterized protein